MGGELLADPVRVGTLLGDRGSNFLSDFGTLHAGLTSFTVSILRQMALNEKSKFGTQGLRATQMSTRLRNGGPCRWGCCRKAG